MDDLISRLGERTALDRPAEVLTATAERTGLAALVDRVDRALGHPVHPALTDLPIGCWTSAWVLDIVGRERSRPAARLLCGLGVVTAVPTIATGLGNVPSLSPPKRRVAVLHAVSNALATLFYAQSWRARGTGDHARGVRLGWVGATVATIGGALGGYLALGGESA